MSISFNTSVSGVRAALDVLGVSAHNIANVNTDGFKKQEVVLREGHNGGVDAAISESSEPGSSYQNEDGEIVEASNVDLPDEIADQLSAKHLLSANLAVIKRTDEAYESLMDIIA